MERRSVLFWQTTSVELKFIFGKALWKLWKMFVVVWETDVWGLMFARNAKLNLSYDRNMYFICKQVLLHQILTWEMPKRTQDFVSFTTAWNKATVCATHMRLPFLTLNLFVKVCRKDFKADLKVKEPWIQICYCVNFRLFLADVILWKLFCSILIRGLTVTCFLCIHIGHETKRNDW